MPDPASSFKCILRIMQVLAGHETITITNLAMLSRMNHKRCVKHVTGLEKAGIVRIETRSNKKYVSLTTKGREYSDKLSEIGRINTSIYL